jgi:hypothetical protein
LRKRASRQGPRCHEPAGAIPAGDRPAAHRRGSRRRRTIRRRTAALRLLRVLTAAWWASANDPAQAATPM